MKNNKFIPFCKANITRKEVDEVINTIESGWLTMGKKVILFEENFAKYVGVNYAISVNSCTAALELALMAHGIGKGDEVIVPSFTFASTANVIVHVGAKPIFTDIDPETLNISPLEIEKNITRKTKAIIAVHYAGLPADMVSINKLAKKHNLIVIEDAAHAVGSKLGGKMIGSTGNTTAFSFYATKNLTTGEGGMLTTNDEKIADYVSKARMHGISKDAWKRYSKEGTWKYDITTAGLKCNMTDMQAAIGLHQLAKLDKLNDKRKKLVDRYNNAFANDDSVTTIKHKDGFESSYHLYPILLNSYNRDIFIQQMTKNNIGVSVHFIPVHTFSFYKTKYKTSNKKMKNTQEVFSKIVSLPLFPDLSYKDQDVIIKTVKSILNAYEK